jgi:hypothetical protein
MKDMSALGEVKTVKVRKPRACDYCGEMLEKGEQAVTWTYTYPEFGSASVHPECKSVLDKRDGDYEFSVGESPRGCDCGYSKGCECGWEARNDG